MVDVENAKALGISQATFYVWLSKHVEFQEAVKEGKRKPDEEVEASLFKRAMGFEYTEVEAVPDGKGGQTVRKATRKLIAGDVTAMIFWLKNRVPHRWRDVRDVRTAVLNEDGYQGLTPEEADKLEARLAKVMPEVFGGNGHAEKQS